MTAPDMFVVELVLDGHRMRLTGPDLDAAVLALAARGHTYAEIADRCHLTERGARRAVGSARARITRAEQQAVA